ARPGGGCCRRPVGCRRTVPALWFWAACRVTSPPPPPGGPPLRVGPVPFKPATRWGWVVLYWW
ncbi:hypothetical protein, partial [Xanthomonas oryzae]|uniref:hypothetical protein n=1 Tax=Xanthomonas oryzae TaxID=347 RepID=UPI001C4AD94F